MTSKQAPTIDLKSGLMLLLLLLIPPFAIGLGVVFLGETLSYEAWVGFGLIAVGLAVTDGRLLKYIR